MPRRLKAVPQALLPVLPARLKAAREALARVSSAKVREGYARYGISVTDAIGVGMKDIHAIAKECGRDHELALELWKTGLYEARMLACLVADSALITKVTMCSWARDLDNWAICDTACFHLFDQSPHAESRVPMWCKSEREFVRRAGFALIASVALHRPDVKDTFFRAALKHIEASADDERNFVKKGVSWALRGIGMRSKAMHKSAIALARRLTGSESRSARWIGKDALKDLSRPLVLRRVKAKDARRAKAL